MKRRFKIIDRFTNMKKADGTPMSRQQIHMLRKRARGLCWICSKAALEGGYFCLDHQIQARERMRKKLGCRRRNTGAASYKLKEKAQARSKRQMQSAKSKKVSANVKKTKAGAKTAKAKSAVTTRSQRPVTRHKAKVLPRTTRKAVARN